MEISGLIKDSKTEAPLPGATVSLSIGSEEPAVIPSDDKGEFTYSREASYIGEILTCQVEKEGYEAQKIEHEVKEEKVDLGIIELVPYDKEIAFSLHIKDETGNPLSGVNISLDLDTEHVGSGRSDESGLFKMTLRRDLVGKTLKYTAKRLLYKTETGQIQIEKKKSAEITMKRIVFPLWAKIAAGIAAIIFAVILILILISKRRVTVPDVIGKTELQATIILKESGLQRGKVTYKLSRGISGTVIDQKPKAREKVRTKTQVELVVAGRPEPVTVPSVVGKTLDEATAILKRSKLQRGEVTSSTSRKTRNTVIRQNPEAGKKVRILTKVNLVVSSGSGRPTVVPSVIGKTLDEATAILKRSRLQRGEVTYRRSPVKRGTVISQKPGAREKVPILTEVNLVVSQGRII